MTWNGALRVGLKVEAACRFVERTRRVAGIGALADAHGIFAGRRGTLIRQAAIRQSREER